MPSSVRIRAGGRPSIPAHRDACRARTAARHGSAFVTVVDAGAVAGGRVLRLEVPAPVEQVLEAHDLARREQAHAVAEVELGREVLAYGERRAAERGVV